MAYATFHECHANNLDHPTTFVWGKKAMVAYQQTEVQKIPQNLLTFLWPCELVNVRCKKAILFWKMLVLVGKNLNFYDCDNKLIYVKSKSLKAF